LGQAVGFLVRFAALSRRAGIWHVLAANALYQTAAFALFTYLAAFLTRTYAMQERATALPLAAALFGALTGSLLGGTVAGRTWRIGCVAVTLLAGGVFAGVVFIVAPSLWLTVLLAAIGAVLLTVFEPVTWALMAELASESRATANGMLAASNQLGATLGASGGGLVLAVGGFSMVGLLCLTSAALAAMVIGAKMRGIGTVRARAAAA
jgi:MFS transporter, DHA1 family, inner membrane transport protein